MSDRGRLQTVWNPKSSRREKKTGENSIIETFKGLVSVKDILRNLTPR